MRPPTLSDNLVSSFGFFSKREWAEAAKQELDGADPFEKLKRRLNDTDILPYYDSSDLPARDFQLPVSQNEFLGPRAWRNLSRIQVNHVKEANEQALISLQSGADGILFDLRVQSAPDELLNKIEMPYCSTVFLTSGGQEKFFDDLIKLSRTRNYDPSSLPGAIFWNAPSPDPVGLIEQYKEWNEFHPLGVISDGSASPANEIAHLLVKAVMQIDNFISRPELMQRALTAIGFSLGAGYDFFVEIAKLKALRMLWKQVSGAYDPNCNAPAFIHVTIKPFQNESYQPHGNMIRGTTGAMSAILGGCDAITVEPADDTVGHVARNVSSILREESHLEKVADPTAGSYYIAKLTDQLGAEAWEKFQKLVG